MSDANIAEIGIGSAETMAGRVINKTIFETPVTIRRDLTNFEQMIFNRLAQANGEVVSKDELCEAVYPNGHSQNPNSNGIEVFVARLRKKIGQKEITTVRGRGYILRKQPEAVTSEVTAEQPATAAAG
jgi:DNA-binding response OmpR family regulator